MNTASNDYQIWNLAANFPDKDVAFNLIRLMLDPDALHEVDLPSLLRIAEACKLA